MLNPLMFAAILFTLTATGCSGPAEEPVSEVTSGAYAGHENDRDIRNFVLQYHPLAAETRLDNCQTCHRSGVAGTDTECEFSQCGHAI